MSFLSNVSSVSVSHLQLFRAPVKWGALWTGGSEKWPGSHNNLSQIYRLYIITHSVQYALVHVNATEVLPQAPEAVHLPHVYLYTTYFLYCYHVCILGSFIIVSISPFAVLPRDTKELLNNTREESARDVSQYWLLTVQARNETKTL
jgi:hypothetical protein